MKPIEKTFKAEKEILEEFFKNKRIKKINKISYPFSPFSSQQPSEEYISVSYYGEIKNPQELNIKNSFDLIDYLNPCFVYIASDNKAIKEKLIEERGDGLGVDDENFYFVTSLFLTNYSRYEPVGFDCNNEFKQKFKAIYPLDGYELKMNFEHECREKNNIFLFNNKPIHFEFIFKINRSYDYIMVLMNEWVTNQYFIQVNMMSRRLFF